MYDPPLPGVRDQLTQRMPNGSAMKAFFIYDEPFWRNDGFNGQLISDIGPARMSNDTCIPGDDHGVILLFLEGEQARTYGRIPEAERRERAHRRTRPPLRQCGRQARVLRRRRMVGTAVDPRLLQRQPRTVCVDHLSAPALSAPIGVIHWASTDTATYWSAYMEGAVDAGERAASANAELL